MKDQMVNKNTPVVYTGNMKPDQNAPCPCGSGKKYKDCCMEKIIPLPWATTEVEKPSLNTPHLFEEFQQLIGDRKFASEEELMEYMDAFLEQKSERPVSAFLGLSSAVMNRLLSTSFIQTEDLVDFNPAIDRKKLLETPLIRRLLCFLNTMEKMGSVKATAQGNLSRAFIQSVWDQEYYNHTDYPVKPMKEDDLRILGEDRYILRLLRIIKTYKKQFSLTKRGKTRLADPYLLYYEYYQVYTENFHWSYQYSSPEWEIIQRACRFNLYLLKQMAEDWIKEKTLAKAFITAFPEALQEARSFHRTPESQLSFRFLNHFIYRFALPFGFIEWKKIENTHSQGWIRITPLFKELFVWNL